VSDPCLTPFLPTFSPDGGASIHRPRDARVWGSRYTPLMFDPRATPLDSRLALRIYAALVGTTGFLLIGWGPMWLGTHLAELPFGRAAIVRIAGAIMCAASLVATGLSTLGPRTRTRMVYWFLAAHALVWLMLAMQNLAILGGIPVIRHTTWILLMLTLGLFYVVASGDVWRPASPLTITAPRPDDPGTGGAEQQIRDAAAQEERNRLARELHDAVKQQIFAIQTSAATAEARFDTDVSGTRAALAQVRQSAREAMTEMEAMLEQLRVTPLGNTGLVEAISKQCDALAFRTGAEVDLRVEALPADDTLPAGAHQAIFRIVQEALANVGRHARARHVWVSLATTAARLEVRVQDDGIGFDQRGTPGGMGLHNMRARAAEVGGSVQVEPADARGTVVTFSIPYETADSRRYRRRQALRVAAVFGVFAVLGVLNLVENGPAPANVFVVFFALAFGHNLRLWLQLRREGRGSRQTAPKTS
jgi:signal transduction histidine kinase